MQKNIASSLCSYRYDPLDRLSRSQPEDQASIGRFYNKLRLTTEIQGLNRHSIFQHGDQLLAQHSGYGKATDTALLATDTQRSVLTEVSRNTHQTAAYTAYGHKQPVNGLLSLVGFNGERPDPVTGHYLLGNGYRAFNPVLMRFNSPDSWSPFGKGGINAYAYCKDPISQSDPSGHSYSWNTKWGVSFVESPDNLYDVLNNDAYKKINKLKAEFKATDDKFNINLNDQDMIKGRKLAKAYDPTTGQEPTIEAMDRKDTHYMANRDHAYISRKVKINQDLLNALKKHAKTLPLDGTMRTYPNVRTEVTQYISNVQRYLNSLITKKTNRAALLKLIERHQGIHRQFPLSESSPDYITSISALIRERT